MTTYTLNRNNPDILNINSKPAIQAATADGKAILLAILEFAKGESEKGTSLHYVPTSKCWLDNSRKIVLFNVAETEDQSAEAIELVRQFAKHTGFEVPVKTDVATGGVLTTDKGEPIAVTKKALEDAASDENDTSTKGAELIKVDSESTKPKKTTTTTAKKAAAKTTAKATSTKTVAKDTTEPTEPPVSTKPEEGTDPVVDPVIEPKSDQVYGSDPAPTTGSQPASAAPSAESTDAAKPE